MTEVHGYLRIMNYDTEEDIKIADEMRIALAEQLGAEPENLGTIPLGVESGHIEFWNDEHDLVGYLDDYAPALFTQFPEIGEHKAVYVIATVKPEGIEIRRDETREPESLT